MLLDWFIRIVKKAKDKESLLAALTFVDNEPEGQPRTSGDKARALVEECGGNVQGMLRARNRREKSCQQVAKLVALPIGISLSYRN